MSGTLRSCAKWLLPARLQRQLRNLLITLSRNQYTKRQIQRTYGEFTPTIELVDLKGEKWYDRDREFEPEIRELMQHKLVAGARVFDLGAHQGVVALALAQIVGEAGSVVAVEAIPTDATAAERNRVLNDCSQLAIVNAAISEERGEVEFVRSGRVAFGDRTLPTIKVAATTIDELAMEYGHPDVLFVDVDGYEIEALRGATKVLESRPDCYVEVHCELLPRYGHCSEDVLNFFSRQHYCLMASNVMKDSERTFVPFDPSMHNDSHGFHLLAISKE